MNYRTFAVSFIEESSQKPSSEDSFNNIHTVVMLTKELHDLVL